MPPAFTCSQPTPAGSSRAIAHPWGIFRAGVRASGMHVVVWARFRGWVRRTAGATLAQLIDVLEELGFTPSLAPAST